jgi:hypothetical protein
MAEFVRAQIFGTTFEITSRYGQKQPRHTRIGGAQRGLTATSDTRICSLWAWVPSALSGELSVLRRWWIYNLRCKQFRKGSAHRVARRNQEDHEAVQHTRSVQAHIPRVEAPEALAP